MVAALVRGGGGKENTEVHRCQVTIAEESTKVHRCWVTIAEERREATATSYDSVLPTGGIGSSSVKNWAEGQRHMSQRGDKDETNNSRLSGPLHLRRRQEILSSMCPMAGLSTEASRTCLGCLEIPGLCLESADMDCWCEGEVRRGCDAVAPLLLQLFSFPFGDTILR